MGDVVAHEGGDEVVAVIVPGLRTQQEVDPGSAACLLEQVRLQLLLQKTIRVTLIDEDTRIKPMLGDELTSIVLLPAPAIRTQVAAERLLAPGTLSGRDDRGKRRDGLVLLWVADRKFKLRFPWVR
jgi:hypothetical protein